MVNFTKLLLQKGGVSRDLHKNRISCLTVWNLTKKCNLTCKHCYISAQDRFAKNELSTKEAKKTIDQLKKINAGMVLFSGGEPLLRNDLFELIDYAKKNNVKCALSTNGTLITEKTAKDLKATGIIYAGISIDGNEKVHNRFRGDGSFKKSIQGITNCKKAGIPVGIRFTVNKLNYKSLPDIFDIIEQYEIPRFCMYHLVYSGRAEANLDIGKKTRKKIIDYLIKKTFDLKDKNLEILTVDNPCDGIYLYKYITEKYPQRKNGILQELAQNHGRCSAGERIMAISPTGDIYTCQFWNHHKVGNIRKNSLSEIWSKAPCTYLNKLRDKEKHLKGKCAECKYNEFCGGCRLRAKAVYNDIWQEDPSCFLTKQQINQ